MSLTKNTGIPMESLLRKNFQETEQFQFTMASVMGGTLSMDGAGTAARSILSSTQTKKCTASQTMVTIE